MAVRAETLRHRSAADGPPAVGAVVLAAVIVAAAAAAWLVSSGSPSVSDVERAAAAAAFEGATGVRIVRLALTGGGGLVDLRYQILDEGLAETIHETPPTLVDEGTDEVIDTYFMGHVHGGIPKAGSSYPLLFVNEQGLIERGGSVSVAIGDSVLEHVVVQ